MANLTKLETAVEEIEPSAEVLRVQATLADPNTGMVLLQTHRQHEPTEWIVWRWATTYSSGTPIPFKSGCILWSGGYFHSFRQAVEDFESRSAHERGFEVERHD